MFHSTQSGFDCVIVGAGISGILTAARLHQANPSCKILLVEKESHIGGRVTARSMHPRLFPLFGVTPPLFQFVNQTLRLDPENPDLESFLPLPQDEEVGIFCGGELYRISRKRLLQESVLKMLAGPQVARQWEELQTLWQPLQTVTPEGEAASASPRKKLNEKNRAHQALHVLFQLADSASIWGLTEETWPARAQALCELRIRGNWEPALRQLLPTESETVQVDTDRQVLRAVRKGGMWQIETSKGMIESQKLVVAQSPWQALEWLDRDEFPSLLFQRASKTQPVSTVLLSEKLTHTDGCVPDLLFLPAQASTMIRSETELTFYTHIEYETSLDAPSVVKAIRRLRRAREKVRQKFPTLVSEGEYVALRTIASTAPHRIVEKRICEKIKETIFPKQSLAFCGDAYGDADNPDENIIRSILAAVETFR